MIAYLFWHRAYPTTTVKQAKAKDYTREQWEVALEKAEQRAEPDEWPLIITDDFF
jgi:hypothetical protein